MDTRFDSQNIEKKIYEQWEKSGFFNPDICVKKGITKKSAKSFTIVLPPPNVTGTLHMGHAAMLVIEDIMVRYARMKGLKTLWLPGTDSAAIATQAKVESEIYKKEEKTRYDLGREELLRRINIFTDESKNTIINQLKRMGSSLDWSRYAYTLDEKRYRAVMEAFVKMYKARLIYRGARIVNWDPKLQTTVSDDELEWIEEKSPFYYLKYGPFVIGTARPETKFGDKYVVMHPADKRYQKYKHGEKINLEWINGQINATIIKDKAIDIGFGTGAMTITPWHDNTDFEIAERHKLDKDQIIDYKGRLLPIAGEFAGEHIKKARPLIVEKLKSKGLLEKIDESYLHRVAVNSRGGGVIEPQIKEQWFVDVNKKFRPLHSKIKGIKSHKETSLKELMKQTVKSGQIKIMPGKFEKVYYHWINNLRDWCISRQIWFGHRIPVWYCLYCCDDHSIIITFKKPIPIKELNKESGGNVLGITTKQLRQEFIQEYPDNWEEKIKSFDISGYTKNGIIVSTDKPLHCPNCNKKFVIQDPDTLDTWFSSGLWTFSTLGWPKQTQDLKNYHPTNVLETGYDIIFFWVARMILMTGFLLEDVPFHKVYLHGLVRDGQGRKMSKSLGNIIDPLSMIEKYGADATRLSLIIGAGPGNDMKLSEDKVRGYRNFVTKVWNASRFVVMNYRPVKTKVKLTVEDKRCLKELEATKKRVEKYLEKFDFNRAGETIYHYFWHTFADKIIEETKPRLNSENSTDREAAQQMLVTILRESLKMLHPFIPFVTEEVWGLLPSLTKRKSKSKMLLTEQWR